MLIILHFHSICFRDTKNSDQQPCIGNECIVFKHKIQHHICSIMSVVSARACVDLKVWNKQTYEENMMGDTVTVTESIWGSIFRSLFGDAIYLLNFVKNPYYS